MNPDIITMGRISVDLYPAQINRTLEEVETFTKTLGGSPTNVAVAAARLGRTPAVITKVGDDPFGRYCKTALENFGVDSRWVGHDPSLHTPVVFCEIHPPDHFPLLFYREAPDMNLEESDLDLEAIAEAPIFWTTGTGLSDEPSRTTTLRALRERGQGITVHDLDYRPSQWNSLEEARRWSGKALEHATVAVGNQEEVEMAMGTADPTKSSRALLDRGLEVAIVKRGKEGVLARTPEERVEVSSIPVDVVNGLGAGDAFGGALCHALLSGWDLKRTVEFANAAGALQASRRTCADEMPSGDEIEQLLRDRSGE